MKATGVLLYTAFLVQAVFCAELPGQLKLSRNLTSEDVQNTEILLEQVSSDTQRQQKRAYLHRDGSFHIRDIPEGEYLLSIVSIDLNLIPMRALVEVSHEDSISAYVVTSSDTRAHRGPQIPLPFELIANPKLPERAYLKERNPGILKSGPIAVVLNNPLYLAAALLVLLSMAVPFLMEKFDPESAKIVREQREARRGEPSQAAVDAVKKLAAVGTDGGVETVGTVGIITDGKNKKAKPAKKRKS